MQREVMKPIVLFENRTAWGSVRMISLGMYPDRPETLHLEVWPLGAQAWQPFCSLTVIDGKLAYRNYDCRNQPERQLDGTDISGEPV